MLVASSSQLEGRGRDKEEHLKERGEVILGFYNVQVEFYTEKVLCGFLPCGFPKENICVLCVTVLFFFQ